MSQLQLFSIYFLLILATVHVTVQLKCSYTEGEIECPADCSTVYCPTSETQNGNCPNTAFCNNFSCECGFNNRRSANGTCISTRECPPFKCSGQNEEYDACPPYCPTDDCSQATPSGDCPLPGRIGIVVECYPECRCIQGYWRKNDVCVPYDECPKN